MFKLIVAELREDWHAFSRAWLENARRALHAGFLAVKQAGICFIWVFSLVMLPIFAVCLICSIPLIALSVLVTEGPGGLRSVPKERDPYG